MWYIKEHSNLFLLLIALVSTDLLLSINVITYKITELSLSLTSLLLAALHKHFLYQIPAYVTYIQEICPLLLYSSCLC